MADLDYALVTGRFALAVADGVDADDNPDTVWCSEGRVVITPLNTFVKVADGIPSPFTIGGAQIEATIDSEGYLTYRGKRSVNVVDLTSPKVNPVIGPGLATHRVEFIDVATADGTRVPFPKVEVRLTREQTNDLTLVSPLLPGEVTPIVQGPRGFGIASTAVEAGDLIVTYDDGTSENVGELPVGPGGSDAGVASYIDVPTSETARKLSATVVTAIETGGRYVGTRAVALADSITASGDLQDQPGGGGWFETACARSFGRILWVRNAGIPSNTPAQMFARLQTDVLAYDPDVVFVMGGSNGDLANAQTNLPKIWDALVAAGVRVIVCTIPPIDADPGGKPVTLNAWLRTQATARGFDLVDFYAALVNPVTQKYYPALVADGVHPTRFGQDVMATAALAQALPRFPAVRPYLAPVEDDPANGVPGPLLLLDRQFGDGSTFADDPRGYGTFAGANVTRTMVRIPGVPGRVHQFMVPPNGGASTVAMLTAAGDVWRPIVIVPGAKYRAALRIQTADALLNGVAIDTTVEVVDGSGNVLKTIGLNQSTAGEIVDGVWSQEFTAPAGSARARIGWGHSAPAAGAPGTTRLGFAQPTVVQVG